ncbi:hypothetical protein P7K49_016952 [Saguinus oedipus]|uniref:Myocardial zonula adherens protein n=1 Tax=Saguinus oedipus TaxID=9490 RepID=A0ABQ9V1I1_SAGOE|nr:hypothetical protein P7K49_016952 [Saguinus oedipus]
MALGPEGRPLASLQLETLGCHMQMCVPLPDCSLVVKERAPGPPAPWLVRESSPLERLVLMALLTQGQTHSLKTKSEHHLDLSNEEPTRKLPRGVVYGVVRRSDENQQKEMVVYGWSTSQLKEEMNYIRDVRATLEKVRKRMYGDYDEMRQKIQQLTQELSVSHAQQEYLENHIQTQSSALDSFNAMNSALASDSIGLQVLVSLLKTLVDVTLENSNIKDQIRNLQQTYEASMDKLREKQRQLEVAQVENQLLKMKVESSQEANAEVMREMTKKLYSQYQEKLQEEQRRQHAEKEALLEETNSFLKAIEEANKKMQAAEISLEEKDQRIGELDRLIERMEKERHQLQLQLLEHETEMSGEVPDSDKERYQQLEEASASLRERIRHLDDMVHCQQKKVKQMVEEVDVRSVLSKEKHHFAMISISGNFGCLGIAFLLLNFTHMKSGARASLISPM